MAKVIDPDPLGLTVQHVSGLTGLSVTTVQLLSDRGEIRCLRVQVGKHKTRRYRRSWVEEFIAAHTIGPKVLDEGRAGAASFRRSAA